MILYRGTKIAGLKEMRPRLVNHDKPYVYATTDKIKAIIYSVKGGNLIIQIYMDMMMIIKDV